jgi:prefoldin subunit 5
VEEQGMDEQEIINVLKLANNSELPYFQEKVDYLRDQINILELEKTECTTDILTLNRRIDEFNETANLCESYLNEKRVEVTRLNQELKGSDNLNTNKYNINKNNEEIEIFYASGSWHSLAP